MRTLVAALTAAVLLFTLAPGPVRAESDEAESTEDEGYDDPVDFDAYIKESKNFERLREISRQHMIDLHALVMQLPKVKGTEEEGTVRYQIRQRLLEERRVRHAVILRIDRILGVEKNDTPDTVVLEKLNNTTMGEINWDDRKLIDIMGHIERLTGVPIRTHPRVGKYNGVTLDLPNPSCATIMDFICQGLEYKWLVFHGRIHIVRQISRTEERFQAYEKRHGKVDYWKDEPPALEKVVDGKRVQMGVYELNTNLLRQNLMKFFMLAEESRLHNGRLKEQAFMQKYAINFAKRDGAFMEKLKKREKTIAHYLNVEKDASIEVLDIISRVLGDKVRLEDTSNEWQRILATPINGGIEWVDVPLAAALEDLGGMVGLEVTVEIPVKIKPFISLHTDKITLHTALRMIQDLQPIIWTYKEGKVFFVYGG